MKKLINKIKSTWNDMYWSTNPLVWILGLLVLAFVCMIIRWMFLY